MNRPESVKLTKAFGGALREIRRERGLSQEQLGFEAGLHRTYVSLLERGRKIPTLTTLAQLAVALGLAPSEMLRQAERRIESLQDNHDSKRGHDEDRQG
ncbi:MAG: helix-turn-helix transcriptional regulator [Deltaproteobacteria bacterium]|nr:helix-turn-helix transcriptional regulator [Deltaproteobacteria bacterium]